MGSELTYRGLNSQSQEFTSYSPKPQKRMPWLARPVRYLLSEQRLVFVLLGMFVTTLVFVFVPKTGESEMGRQVDPLASHGMTDLTNHGSSSLGLVHSSVYERSFVGGKIPLGLKRKGLRIVVTGGAGFVGSHLVDRLIERGDSVIVVDNFFTGNKDNVMHHFGNPNFEMIRHDVVEPILLEVDQIYHLACPASPVHYKFNPVKTIISFSNQLTFFLF
ncbi:hypothetical protein LUZ60_013929 [Juncus effusus]|nr:hypothetical protein LUZ60_013929 [Juncus effusus]